ncbi:putative nucleotide-diphospho-sugar transferase [Neobacillus piezotolerans]|uniref:putative nucleotide-diphospho-sugar transferase n=1 Tax=Neobacillus piezotolerans TaxID=2259171 RepID=UPI0015F1A8E2|nr:putative nucleotide-diphospho-sugar transferase [Neobacillus piezotolerans]
MKHLFNPYEKEGIHQETRLVLYNTITNQYEKKIIIPKGTSLTIHEDELLHAPYNYKFKYQIRDKERWIDKTSYKPVIDSLMSSNFLVDGYHIGQASENFEALYNLAVEDSPNSRIILRNMIVSLMQSIWRDRNHRHQTAKEFISFALHKYGIKDTFFGNLLIYLDYYLKFKQDFNTHGLNYKSYKTIFEQLTTQNSPAFILERLNELDEAGSKMAFTDVLRGKLLSFIGSRAEAETSFSNISSEGVDYIKFLYFDQGLFTYSFPTGEYSPGTAKWISNGKVSAKKGPFFLLSLDTRFLRLYGPQLFYFAGILTNYPFHFHLIGDKDELRHLKIDAINYLNQMQKFMGQPASPANISITTEQLPNWVKDKKTYYSCARFIQASNLMKHYDRDVYIMDADMSFTEDPSDYLSQINNGDVAFPFSIGVVSLCPWRRMMAGNVFIKNNAQGHEFLDLMNHYFEDNLTKPTAWTLDQNALSFVYEQSVQTNSQIRFFDISQLKKRPLGQEKIRKNIEKLR